MKLLALYESTISIFPSFHQEPLVKKHLCEIEMILQSDIRNDYIEPKDWPSKSLLFDTNINYKGSVANIHCQIEESFDAVNNYVKVSWLCQLWKKIHLFSVLHDIKVKNKKFFDRRRFHYLCGFYVFSQIQALIIFSPFLFP